METPNENKIPDDILGMSDEEAMEAIASAGPIEDAAPVQVVDHDETQKPDGEAAGEAGDGAAAEVVDTGEAGGGKTEGEDAGAAAVNEDPANAKPGEVTDPNAKPADEKPADEKPAEPAASQEKALSSYTAEEKAAAFDALFGTKLRANGKDIEIRTPDEAKRLMQMGCDYTRKLQKLQPKLRAITMLENNGLLDENQLAFAIDLIKKEPSAINKLLADAQFDPMSADKDQAANYKPGDHQVSDSEMAFNRAVDDVFDTATGPELLLDVQKQWDEESKKWLFQHPDMLHTLNQQKTMGVYQLITDEMARRQALGQIPQGTPWMQAYRVIGDHLEAQGAFKQLQPQQTPTDQVPVETRVAAPAPAMKNDDKAAAAAPTKAAPAAVEQADTNALGMSDEAWLKQMEGRL